MCWCDRLWIWCLYAYTASTSTMIHPIMPPATGPTGALLIMFRDATSSSAEEREKSEGQAEGCLMKFQRISDGSRSDNTTGPVSNSSGSDPNSRCDAGTFSTPCLFSHQCEMQQKKIVNSRQTVHSPFEESEKKKQKNYQETEKFQSKST